MGVWNWRHGSLQLLKSESGAFLMSPVDFREWAGPGVTGHGPRTGQGHMTAPLHLPASVWALPLAGQGRCLFFPADTPPPVSAPHSRPSQVHSPSQDLASCFPFHPPHQPSPLFSPRLKLLLQEKLKLHSMCFIPET